MLLNGYGKNLISHVKIAKCSTITSPNDLLMVHVRCRKEEPVANSYWTGSLAINKPAVIEYFWIISGVVV